MRAPAHQRQTSSRRNGMINETSVLGTYHRITSVVPTVLGFVVMWASFSIVTQNNKVIGQKGVLSIKHHAKNESLCESPSLPRGSIHIVVATYKYNETEANVGFDDNNYLWDLGLTNADIFWYRRVQPEEPLREVEGPCGMKLHERLLLPNYGRDGAAFFDHVLEVYDNPPRSIIFLHGHAAIAWHTSCESVFARSAYVYRDLANPFPRKGDYQTLNKTVRNHLMTLTSHASGTRNFDLSWYGGSILQDEVLGRRRLTEVIADTQNKSKSPCTLFRERWNEQVFSRRKPTPFQSCCASFILPGERIRRYPRAFYEDLQSVLTDETYQDQGRECFEYIVYGIFSDEFGKFTNQDFQTFYDEADGLVYGRNRSATTLEPDGNVLLRMEGCKATRDAVTVEEEIDYRAYVRRRKWRNTWKRLGFYRNTTK